MNKILVGRGRVDRTLKWTLSPEKSMSNAKLTQNWKWHLKLSCSFQVHQPQRLGRLHHHTLQGTTYCAGWSWWCWPWVSGQVGWPAFQGTWHWLWGTDARSGSLPLHWWGIHNYFELFALYLCFMKRWKPERLVFCLSWTVASTCISNFYGWCWIKIWVDDEIRIRSCS